MISCRRMLFILFSLVLARVSGPLTASEVVSGEFGQKIDRYMRKAEANGYAGSVLVARGESIMLAKGYGLADREKKVKETAETVFSIGSITKQFTGAAILKLEMLGKLKVADPISKYFGDIPADKKEVTLHHLLTHTAGFKGALGDDYDPIGREEFIRLALGSKLLFKPGEKYEYSNVGFSLLGIIVELVSGEDYEEFLYEELFKPAGMEKTGYLRPLFTKSQLAVGYRDGERWGTALDRPWRPEGPGWHLRANGGILSTVGDMHRWYLALKKDTILSKSAKEKYFAPHVKEYEEGNSYYGYGWVSQKTGRGATLIWHNGGNGIYNAFMGFEPENDLVMIVSSNIAGKISDNYAEKIHQIVSGDYKELDERVLAEYSGTYRLPSGAEVEVRFDENDNLQAAYRTGELVGLLAGTGREVKEEVERYDRKVKEMLSGVLAGDFKALADAWGEPVDAVKPRASVFWEAKKKELGEVKGLEVLGTVTRPRNLLTYVRVDFAKSSRFFTYIWDKENGRLQEMRESESLEREFEPRSQDEFFSPLIGTTIVFKKDEKGENTLMIRKDGMEVRARKIVAEAGSTSIAPVEYVFASPGGVGLKAYVFSPQTDKTTEPRPAVVLFHGGGWTTGEPQWGFLRARHFAERGLVAVAAQYRLSNEKTGVTPVEAMADARAAIRWMRENAGSLGIDPERIAAYGWSAGGHLAASAAIFDDAAADSRASAAPNALVLVSPAVSLGQDRWLARLLGSRAKVSEISPDEHVRKGLPPTLILQGSHDSVTPLSGVKRFYDRMRSSGNRCEMHIYEGYGHLFTPPGVPDSDWPKPDPATQADAMARADSFLKSLSFMK